LNVKRDAWVKIKFCPVHTMQEYTGRKDKAPLVLRHYTEVSGQLHALFAVPLAKNPQ
jgi:hypothetical protein